MPRKNQTTPKAFCNVPHRGKFYIGEDKWQRIVKNSEGHNAMHMQTLETKKIRMNEVVDFMNVNRKDEVKFRQTEAKCGRGW